MPDVAAWAFEGRIYRQGILRGVDVPRRVAGALDDWRYPQVVVSVGGRDRATTLMRRGGGGFRLFLHDELRSAAGVGEGDRVLVELRVDDAPVDVLPDDILEAAEHVEGGLVAVELLPPGLRREMMRFVGGAKSASVRAQRVARVVELIGERAEKLRRTDDG